MLFTPGRHDFLKLFVTAPCCELSQMLMGIVVPQTTVDRFLQGLHVTGGHMTVV
jgi:hypothetical protein